MAWTLADSAFLAFSSTVDANCSIAADVYDAAKRAILESVPKGKVGITFPELLAEVRRRVPRRLFAGKSVDWYATTVKLDLEAHGLIARVPGARPQRLVRKGRAS